MFCNLKQQQNIFKYNILTSFILRLHKYNKVCNLILKFIKLFLLFIFENFNVFLRININFYF